MFPYTLIQYQPNPKSNPLKITAILPRTRKSLLTQALQNPIQPAVSKELYSRVQQPTLLCRYTNNPLRIPVKSTHCLHAECFDFDSHLRLSRDERCPICNGPAPYTSLRHDPYTHSLLKTHVTSPVETPASLPKTYPCDTSPKFFTNLSNLRRHQLSHRAVKGKQCQICGKGFTRLDALKRHVGSIHGEEWKGGVMGRRGSAG